MTDIDWYLFKRYWMSAGTGIAYAVQYSCKTWPPPKADFFPQDIPSRGPPILEGVALLDLSTNFAKIATKSYSLGHE